MSRMLNFKVGSNVNTNQTLLVPMKKTLGRYKIIGKGT